MSRSYSSEASSTQRRGSHQISDSDSDGDENSSNRSDGRNGQDIDEVSIRLLPPSRPYPRQLKSLTKHLLNQNWRFEQNKALLYKMLELEEPTISPKVMFTPPLYLSLSHQSTIRWWISC
jgi:hypothetical protein